MNPLDRPVWSSLTTCHAPLSIGGALARRYVPGVNLFGSGCNDSAQALEQLAALIAAGEQLYILQVPQIAVPPGLIVVKQAKGVQMIRTRAASAPTAQDDIQKLTDADAPEMLALAQLTEPGPFLARTHTMGAFIGIRSGGRLSAMAGERFRFPGYTELSGVCTHPDFRGRGLARRLSAAVAAGIEARAETPVLHAWKTNRAAITLYETLGFELRTEVNVAVLERRS
jgi:predicted GNAT family acetyltransferase